MKIVRRWAGLWILSLVVALAAAGALPASASASSAAPVRSAAAARAPAPVQMNYACTSKVTGLMRYAASTSDCTRAENAVTIVPGPVYTCIYFSFLVRRVASASRCAPVSRYVKELTLPPTSAPVYFCALKRGDLLTYISNPGHCNSRFQFPVVVPVPHRAPVLANIESSTLNYYAGTPPVPITSSLTVSDASSTTLASATVSITAGLASSDDSLGFTNQNGITGSYNASTGVLTLTGTASLADYQAALRSVTYKDANALTAAGNRTISFQVNDGAAASNLSNVVTRTIAVATNTPPACKAVSASTDKNTAINITVLSSCSDPDGDTLTLKSVDTTGTKGTVAINSDGTIHYDPNGQFQGLAQGQTATDTFTFTVSDGFQDSAAATVTVTINGVNDKPVISNVETTPLSYQALSAPVAITSTLTLADDTDSTIASATVSITSGFSASADTLAFTNANGITGSYNASTGVLTLSGNASVADYQAALRSVEFSSTDSSASPAARTVSFQVTDTNSEASNTASRTIDVTAAAKPPTVVPQSYNAVGNTTLAVGTTVTTGPAATVSGSLLTGDSGDASCGTLSVTGTTTPTHGTVVTSNADGTFTYLPAAGFTGTDTFQYTVTCGSSGKSASNTVTITVGTVVWYVDDSQSAAGTGESNAPFNTLAAANSAVGANSIVFLYQGSATYTGGLTMKSGDDLWGQPHGLTVGGYDLVAPGGSNPAVTNAGGDGIDLASNTDVENVNVSGTAGTGNGISGSNVSGTITIKNGTITGYGADGVFIQPAAASTTTLTISGNSIQYASNTAPEGSGIAIDPTTANTTGTLTGTISGNTIGTPGNLGSGNGDGMGIYAEKSFTETLSVTGNKVYEYSNGTGIYFETEEGSPTMNLTVTGNTVADPATGSGGGVNFFGTWGIYGVIGAASTDAGTACAAISGNSVAGAGVAANGGFDIEIDQNAGTTVKLPGYTGGAADTNAVASFLETSNTGNGTPTAAAFVSGSGGGFTGGSC